MHTRDTREEMSACLKCLRGRPDTPPTISEEEPNSDSVVVEEPKPKSESSGEGLEHSSPPTAPPTSSTDEQTGVIAKPSIAKPSGGLGWASAYLKVESSASAGGVTPLVYKGKALVINSAPGQEQEMKTFTNVPCECK